MNYSDIKLSGDFRTHALPAMMRKYENTLIWVLKGRRPVYILGV